MNPEPSMLPERDERLGEILAAWIEAAEQGQAPDSAEWLARHAEFAAELQEFLVNRVRLQEAAEPLCQAVRPTAAIAPSSGATPLPMAQESTDILRAMGMIGRSVGEHDLLAEIGQGGMGLVYRARHRRLQRVVALKMLRANVLSAVGDAQRFRNEAEVLAQLDHPHIVPVHDVGEHEGRVYFSMKLIEGGGLDKQLTHFTNDPRAAALLVAQVARAVHHAHQRGILHRDLKPSNILLDRDGQPHVSDFGLAKRMEADGSLTQTGAIVGTPQYMAPEQTSGRKGAVTTATDVYGLGAVLYALLTGRAPFRGETVLETMEQVREREPELPRRVNPKLDRDLETICLKCLQKEPQRRYESAQALAEDLESWLLGKSIRARAVGRLERLWRWCRRNPVIAALSATVLLLGFLTMAGLATGTWMLWREKGETQAALIDAQTNYNRAETQRRRAESNFGKVLDGMTMLLEHLDEKEWRQPLTIEQIRQELAHHMEEFFQRFREDNKDEPLARLELGWAYRHLGVYYLRRGDNVRAEQSIRTALAFHEALANDYPDDPAHVWVHAQSLDLLGNVYHVTGRTEEAHRYFLKVGEQYRRQVRMHPDWRAYHDLAWFLVTCPDVRMRDAAEAIHAASCAAELAPQSLLCRGTVGRAQYRKGEYRAAAVTLQNCVLSREGEKSYDCFLLADCFFLAMAYGQLGDREQAMRYFQRGIHPSGRERAPYISIQEIRAEAAALLGIPEKSTSKDKEESPKKD